MTDRTTKALLAAIALGLWAHLGSDWLRPTPVHAQATLSQILGDPQLAKIEGHLRNISSDTGGMKGTLDAIYRAEVLRRK